MDPNPSSCTCFVLKFYGVGVKMVRAVLTLWSRETNIEPQRSLSDLQPDSLLRRKTGKSNWQSID